VVCLLCSPSQSVPFARTPLVPPPTSVQRLCPFLLVPGPPPFVFSFIPACLFGVGLKGAGWTRTENGISGISYWRRAIR
jgi:hypothetical protein